MFLSFIKTRYSDSDFITQKKALYLFVFCTILVVMVPIIFIVSTVTSPELLGQNIAGMLPIFLTNIIAMFLIARGRNTTAGYLFGTVIAAAVFFLVLTNPRGQSFYDTFFYVLGFTILAMLFTNRVMTALFVLSFIIGAVLYYFIMRDAGVDEALLFRGLTSFIVAQVLTFALVMLMFNMLNNAIRRAQDESAASRRLLDVNTKVLSEVETQMASLLDVSASVNSASQSISDGAQRQASGIEEIAATLEEMGAAISRNADNAGSVNRMSEEALGLAEEGGSIVKRAVDSINEINVASGKIREITAVINDIAFQTNLLALNASVEAARAGEHGRGFAVVANEVRNLSLRSGASAKEIGGLIKDSIEKIDNGTQLVNTSGGALERIIESMKNVRPVVAEISAALDEQRRGMGQVNGAVSEIDALTQDNTRASEALTHSARSLNENAEQLKMLLDTTRA